MDDHARISPTVAPGAYTASLAYAQAMPGTYAGPRYASVWLRIAAAIIDAFIVEAIIFVPFQVLVIASDSAVKDGGTGPIVAVLLALFTLYFTLWGTYTVVQEARWGQTLGKRAVGIRVVKDDGSEIGVTAALIRYTFLFFAILGLGGLVTIATIAFSESKQRIGDQVAGTMVVMAR